MKTISQIVVLALVLLGLGGRVAMAQENRLIVAPTIKLPVLVAGEDKVIIDDIDGDLIGAGGQIKVISAITGDVYIGGGEVNFDGSTDQDLVVAGGKVTVSGQVGKNLIVVGGQVKIEDTAIVGGYVLAAGGEVFVNGQIGGPVRAATGKLTVGEVAFIGGNLEADVEQAMVSETAQIIGERRVNVHKVETPKTSETTRNVMRKLAVTGKVIYFLSKLITLLVLVTLAGKLMASAGGLLSRFWTTLGWGMVVAVVTPFVMIILMMSVVGIPLSLVIFGVYLLTMYLSSLVVAMAIGNVILEKGWLPVKNNYLLSVIGLIIISVATNIPVIGWLMSVIICCLGLGIVYRLVTERSKVVAKK